MKPDRMHQLWYGHGDGRGSHLSRQVDSFSDLEIAVYDNILAPIKISIVHQIQSQLWDQAREDQQKDESW